MDRWWRLRARACGDHGQCHRDKSAILVGMVACMKGQKWEAGVVTFFQTYFKKPEIWIFI